MAKLISKILLHHDFGFLVPYRCFDQLSRWNLLSEIYQPILSSVISLMKSKPLQRDFHFITVVRLKCFDIL